MPVLRTARDAFRTLRDRPMTYAIRARSPKARATLDAPPAAPRHCAGCGRGLTQRTRAKLSAEDRLLDAIFAIGPRCDRCTVDVIDERPRLVAVPRRAADRRKLAELTAQGAS